ncbi:group I truncated hemoglobin [Wenzhouxiangella marina]|uniref:Putative Globin-like protein n=1 Tax=Wenzhouxiangella marina TaxID=1579979 RepID=A0A0K0XZZ1_9GAMM|nr:group 1 truncated hemoglobin [Wenzhouxiangella marina]AKS43254.1 Putative Globin-like protein [Wenzhouxiangella marina]MBB6087059.1 hemoglobin [Wenzhouxiangella marina]
MNYSNKTLGVALGALILSACGGVPTNDADESSSLKNYDRTFYEQLSGEDRSLYERLGGYEAIDAIVRAGLAEVLADERINFLFEDTDLDNLQLRLTEQICELAGGPCTYEGLSMEEAHFALEINDAEFNALVEDFQIAMRANDIPYALENQLIALLAPMKPAVTHQ